MKHPIFKNPSAVYASINEDDVRILTVDQNKIELEYNEEITFPCRFMISLLDIDRFKFQEFRFSNCSFLGKKDGHFTNTYTISVDEDPEGQLRQLDQILGRLDSTDQIFSETRYEKNDILKEKKPQMKHYEFEKDKEFFTGFQEEKSSVFDAEIKNSKVTLPAGMMGLSFMASEYRFYNKALQDGFQKTFQDYTESFGIAENGLFAKGIDRVYIGSDFCFHLFPTDSILKKLLDQAFSEGLGITICYPALSQRTLGNTKKSLQIIQEFCDKNHTVAEITINDVGMLEILKEEKITGLKPILGRLLNKRKKDPRMKYRMLMDEYKKDFGRNNLTASHYIKFLHENNIDRFEFESFNFQNEIPAGTHSLHFPFYQISTGSNCLLYANCKNHTVAKQELPVSCPHYCDEFYFSFPKHLDMIGKYNSIFGIEKELFTNQETLDQYASAGIDRLVFSPL